MATRSALAILVQDHSADGSLDRLLGRLSAQMTEVDRVAETVVVSAETGRFGQPQTFATAFPHLQLSARSPGPEETFEQAVWRASMLVEAPYTWTLDTREELLDGAVSRAMDLVEGRPDVDIFLLNVLCSSRWGGEPLPFIPEPRAREFENTEGPLATLAQAVGWMGLVSHPASTLFRTATMQAAAPILEPASLPLLSRSNQFLAVSGATAKFVANPLTREFNIETRDVHVTGPELALGFAAEASRLATSYHLDTGASSEVGPHNSGLLGDLIIKSMVRYLGFMNGAWQRPSGQSIGEMGDISNALGHSSAISHRSALTLLARAWAACRQLFALSNRSKSDPQGGAVERRVRGHVLRSAAAQVNSDLMQVDSLLLAETAKRRFETRASPLKQSDRSVGPRVPHVPGFGRASGIARTGSSLVEALEKQEGLGRSDVLRAAERGRPAQLVLSRRALIALIDQLKNLLTIPGAMMVIAVDEIPRVRERFQAESAQIASIYDELEGLIELLTKIIWADEADLSLEEGSLSSLIGTLTPERQREIRIHLRDDVGRRLNQLRAAASPDFVALKGRTFANMVLLRTGDSYVAVRDGTEIELGERLQEHLDAHGDETAPCASKFLDLLRQELSAKYGGPEDRNVNGDLTELPGFDAAFYRASASLGDLSDAEALDHYRREGWLSGLDPAPGFDVAQYLARNPDVAKAGVEPLQHFVQHGIFEGRIGWS